MENMSNIRDVGAAGDVGYVGGAAVMSEPRDLQTLVSEEWHLARTARVNLLVIHPRGVLPGLLDVLLPDLKEPVVSWRPGQRLALPSGTPSGTMILRDVGALADDEQRRLLDWLEETDGRTQVVSTSAEPLLSRVESGAFLDTLYYRLNTVCVNASAH
ncbi:MAG TPA: hypothetical protein VGY48_30985 [Vicinamibacterales bacterium]|jgi:hypothetical protein|nr:hypothetical protein [Vicinamibacterales bacterium]